jgi:hypothetical protein
MVLATATELGAKVVTGDLHFDWLQDIVMI